MIEGMTEVVPDVRVDVDCVVATRWSKEAREVRDADGQVVAWRPPVESEVTTRLVARVP
jgi:hypothetical protein